MTRVSLLILLIIRISNISFGQGNSVSEISLKAITPAANKEYFINIITNADSTKAIFHLRDSISENVNKDIQIIEYRKILQTVKNFCPDNDTVSLYLKKLDSIYKTYTSYSVDSIAFSNVENEKYLKLTRQVLNFSIDSLENKIGNNNRILMDGTSMTFILRSIKQYNAINLKFGYQIIDIRTPKEVTYGDTE